MAHWMMVSVLNLLSTTLITFAALYFLPIPSELTPWLLLLTTTVALARQTLPALPVFSSFALPFNLLIATLLSIICFNLPFGKWLIIVFAMVNVLLFSDKTYFSQLLKVSSIALLFTGAIIKPTSLPALLGVITLGVFCGSVSFKPFWPKVYLQSDAQIYQRNGFKALAEFTQILFNSFEASYYPQHVYSVERALHFKRLRCLSVIETWQPIVERSGTTMAYTCLQESFTLLVDASQLRFRISDFTVFGLCADEIKQLSQVLVTGLTQLEHQADLTSAQLAPIQRALAEWDAIYQQVINVSAREPIVFILFAETLKRLVLSWEHAA